MWESSNQDDSPRPDSTHSSTGDVDSTATTLRPSVDTFFSPKTGDIELERFDNVRERRRERKGSAASSTTTSSNDDGDGRENENSHLLSHETTTILNQPTAAANSIPEDDAEPPAQPQQVSWSSLPKKSQLAILTLARLSEPLTQTSLMSYMYYQLKSFPGEPSDSTVARQAGFLAAAFTGAQFCTAIMWGRLADWEGMGRKRVILIGLLGTMIGSLGFGFSRSFGEAVFWRFVGGMLNGNIGVMRTMISEMVREKRFQSRAFLLLPMTFNIGVIVGPLLGGLLADPVGSYPGFFGAGGTLGGEEGVWLFVKWPYALPNLVNAVFLGSSALAVVFGLEETLDMGGERVDYGLRLSRWIGRTIFRRRARGDYAAVAERDFATIDDIEINTPKDQKPKPRQKLPFRRIWTKNVLFTLLSHGLLASHVGTFSSLWFVFLSTPRYSPNNTTETLHLPENYQPRPPFTFTGGLALPPPAIGAVLAILGIIGISLQLLLYPRLSFHLGTLKSYRSSLLLFPLAYLLVPFLAIIPSSTPAPSQASGPWIWISITAILCIQVLARTFALPSAAILINNSSPHPSVLGTIHGIAQSVSSLARTVGPVAASWAYGAGLERGVVGIAWWFLAGIAVVGAGAARWVWEGDGHEIWLEGEEGGIEGRKG